MDMGRHSVSSPSLEGLTANILGNAIVPCSGDWGYDCAEVFKADVSCARS